MNRDRMMGHRIDEIRKRLATQRRVRTVQGQTEAISETSFTALRITVIL